jgi:hypothetical protein
MRPWRQKCARGDTHSDFQDAKSPLHQEICGCAPPWRSGRGAHIDDIPAIAAAWGDLRNRILNLKLRKSECDIRNLEGEVIAVF